MTDASWRLVLRRSAWSTAAVAVWLVALSAGFAWPVAWGGWVRGHYEGMRYLVLAEHFRQAVVHAGVYPRWLPELYGGFGYPTFVYYQPLIFWLYALWSLLFSGTAAMLAALGSVALAGNIGVYRLARRFGGVTWACFVAALFMLSPYLYVNLYVRHDLSELSSMFAVPWVLLGVVGVAESAPGRRWRPVALLAVAYAAVVYAHPITGVLMSLSLLPLLVAAPVAVAAAAPGTDGKGEGARALSLGWLRLGVGLACGLMLSAPYWLPLSMMKELVGLERTVTGGFETTLHTVEVHQFFSRAWGFGGSKPGSDDGMPLQVGAVHFVLACAAAAVGRRKPLVVAAAAAYSVGLVGMTPWGEALWRLPVLNRMQFPWRGLAVVTALQCFIIASAGDWVGRIKLCRFRLAGLAAALCLVVAWQWEQFQVDVRLSDVDTAVAAEVASARWTLQRHNSTDEFLPATVARPPRRPRGDAPLLTVPGGRIVFAPDSTPYRVSASVTAARDTRATLRQFFLPGWRVLLNGEPVPEHELRDNLDGRGLMRVNLAVSQPGTPQTFAIVAYYAGPRGASLAGVLFALSALVLLGLCGHEVWAQNQLLDSDRRGR